MSIFRQTRINSIKNRAKLKLKFHQIHKIVNINQIDTDHLEIENFREKIRFFKKILFDHTDRSLIYKIVLDLLKIDRFAIIPLNYSEYPSFVINIEEFTTNIDYIFFCLDDDLYFCDSENTILLCVIADRYEQSFSEVTIFVPDSVDIDT